MLHVLHADLIAFAKEMDPLLNWERQPQDARDRLEERVYSEYDLERDATRFNEKYIKFEVGKALIHNCFKIGKLIDNGDLKPQDLPAEFWKNVKALCAIEEAKKRSVDMANKARGRGVRNNTINRIR